MRLRTMKTMFGLSAMAASALAQSSQPDRQVNGSQKHAAVAELSTTNSASASASDDYLSVTDAAGLETAIDSYLNRNGIKASKVVGNNGAVHFVQVGFTGTNTLPNLLYMISALPPASNGSSAQAQLIGFTVETNVRAPTMNESLYTALGEANKVGNCSWFVDGGSVRCRSWLLIPSPAYPIPAELVKEKIRMINGEWLRFSAQIMTATK
jgi:hypothetical protein